MSNGHDNPNAHHVRQADHDGEMERRRYDIWDALDDLRTHVDRRLDDQDALLKKQGTKLDELIALHKASKLFAAIFSWIVGVAAAIAVTWHNLAGK